MVDAIEQTEKFQEFFELNYKTALQALVQKGGRSLSVDFTELSKFDPDLAEQVLTEPEESLKAAENAIAQMDLPDSLRVRFFNLPASQKVAIRDIRSQHINFLIFFDGVVRQSSDVRPQVVSAKFECPACGNMLTIQQVDQHFKEPSRCTCGRKGKFRLVHKTLVDAQRLVIEEASEDLDGGAQPKRLAVFLREDLVEPQMEKKTTPGNKVRIIGIVKEASIHLRTGGISTRYELLMQANYIEAIQEDFAELEITPEDEQRIKELAEDPHSYDKLVQAIAPSILGHDKIKEALILQLVGGLQKKKEDGTTIRGDMHMLLVGDPGAGKSAMLTFMAKAAPKARYVAGRGVSGVGLTASVVKDEFLRGWALEAGVMVLANKGLCVIDELDKISEEDTSALHEALEQQTVTIAKANIRATLRAETTVLAAANPKFGRFDNYKSIGEQINLPPALINRFDLIFPIRDIPDKVRDSQIAQHILSIQQNPGKVKTAVPVEMLRKYIAYVKQKIFPELTESAIQEIKNFYVTLRNTDSGNTEGGVKPIPISARQLEALVRLAEASARLRLSKKVTRTDAQRAIGLLKSCLMEVGIDPETGQIDIDRISTGITASTRNKILIVREILLAFERRGQKTVAIEDLVAEAQEKKIGEREVEEVLERLKREGEVFEPKRGFFERIT